MDLVGFFTLGFQLAGHVLLHEFRVVRDIPVDIIIGGELIRPHACTISYVLWDWIPFIWTKLL